MGQKLALAGVAVALTVAGFAVIGRGPGAHDLVDAEAQAVSPHTPSARGGRPAAVARRAMNRVRARHGRRGLRYSHSLSRSARRHALWMARHGLGHLSRIRASSTFRSVGEVILKHRGSSPQPRTAIGGWASSPAHRAIMLSSRYGSVGFGVVSSGGATYWVAHTGRR